jgi:hypothetical protein
VLQAEHCEAVDLEDAITMEAWIKPEKFDQAGTRIIDKCDYAYVMFNASSQGGMRHVTICSEDPTGAGAIGLHLAHTDEIGPLFIQYVSVIGFDRGIKCAFQTASQTFEHITLRGQREYGWTNGFSQSVFVRGLDFEGTVTALRSGPTNRGDPGQAKLLLADATLRFTGDGDPPAAVRNQKVAFLRGIRAEGFRAVVSRELDRPSRHAMVRRERQNTSAWPISIARGAGERWRVRRHSLYLRPATPAGSRSFPTSRSSAKLGESHPQCRSQDHANHSTSFLLA